MVVVGSVQFWLGNWLLNFFLQKKETCFTHLTFRSWLALLSLKRLRIHQSTFQKGFPSFIGYFKKLPKLVRIKTINFWLILTKLHFSCKYSANGWSCPFLQKYNFKPFLFQGFLFHIQKNSQQKMDLHSYWKMQWLKGTPKCSLSGSCALDEYKNPFCFLSFGFRHILTAANSLKLILNEKTEANRTMIMQTKAIEKVSNLKKHRAGSDVFVKSLASSFCFFSHNYNFLLQKTSTIYVNQAPMYSHE